MAIVVGAMVIALALLLPSLHLESWPWGVVTWLIVIGFVFVCVVAFWLIVFILRSLSGAEATEVLKDDRDNLKYSDKSPGRRQPRDLAAP